MNQNTTNKSLPFGPSDELQLYYNDAYMKERERFNSLFGVIDDDALSANKVETVYIDPSPDKFVEIKVYKKAKKVSLFWMCVAFLCAAAAAVAFLI